MTDDPTPKPDAPSCATCRTCGKPATADHACQRPDVIRVLHDFVQCGLRAAQKMAVSWPRGEHTLAVAEYEWFMKAAGELYGFRDTLGPDLSKPCPQMALAWLVSHTKEQQP